MDHPSFAAALICRLLEAEGYRVGIIPQPDWKDPEAFRILGRPVLGFLAGAGAMDSMTAHYTAAKRKRSGDAYSPGGRAGLRPDRALLVYTEKIRQAWKEVPVIIGGIEAGLRRFAHYDYWSGRVRRSVLLDSKADILVYGMGEKPLLEIARRLQEGEPVRDIRDCRGTCVAQGSGPPREGALILPPYDAVKGGDPASLRAYAEHFSLQCLNSDPLSASPLAEESDGGRWVIQNPPAFPLTGAELDRIYELPFTRRAHPLYEKEGGIPALKEVSFSLVSSRGCFGGCSFCAITFHQGRAVVSRSPESLVREAESLTKRPDFKGYIHDVGGPTANFYGPPCPERDCLFPEPCQGLKADHGPYIETLTALASVKGVKKVFIRSGIRFDYIALDKKRGGDFLEILCRRHVSGQLKTAPEHVSTPVLAAMGKGGEEGFEVWEKFRRDYEAVNRRLGLKQYLIPYFMSGHPGSSLEDALELALYLKKIRFVPDQVQDFYPTPGTLSTVMYHTGLDPRPAQRREDPEAPEMAEIYVPKEGEKRLQRALLQFNREENQTLVRRALMELGREDLIPGRGKKKPRR